MLRGVDVDVNEPERARAAVSFTLGAVPHNGVGQATVAVPPEVHQMNNQRFRTTSMGKS